MVRPAGKQSMSALEKRPMDYEEPPEGDIGPNHWRWRWNNPCVLAQYQQAQSYWDRHPTTIEGLTFVIHPFGHLQPRRRLICLDWDGAISPSGEIDPGVLDLMIELGSFSERSKSWGNREVKPKAAYGAHTWILVDDCPAFMNNLRKPVGGCKVDILCANPVNVTGDVINGFADLVTIPYAQLEAFPFFDYKEPKGLTGERPEWWSDDPLEDVPPHLDHLVHYMESTEAIEGHGGSQTLFAAACRLMRHGVVGREAEALLRCVPATPPFPADQIQRTIECAYNQTLHDGEFDNLTPEFQAIPEPPVPAPEDVDEGEDREKIYGYNFLTADELLAKDLKLEYLVDQLFVGEGTMFIGGDQKTFKTGLAMDLLVSLCTKAPFLGRFEVMDTRRCAIFTAEIGEVKAQVLLKSILHARGHSRAPGLDIVNEVPQFSVNRDRASVLGAAINRLKLFLGTRRPEVVVFDPLYLAVLGGDAGDMYGMGAVIDTMVKECTKAKAWAIFCHHSRKKNEATEFQPMRLQDFYGTGPAQYARQWMLVSHAQPFYKGVANLYATIGGSTQSREDIYEIQIDEGVTDQIADRRWDVTVECPEAAAAKVTSASILAAMDGVGKVTPAELAVHMNAVGRENLIQRFLHDLVREGRIQMINKRFELSLGGFNDETK